MPNDTRVSAPVFQNAVTRRRFLTRAAVAAGTIAATGAALSGQVAAQSSATSSTPAASPAAEGEWTFTDDRGVTVTLPKRPERVFADLSAAAPLWDFGIKPIAVSGWTTTTDVAWGNVDRSIPDITESADLGVPDAEALIALKPDIYVNITWAKDDPTNVWGFPDAETIARFEEIAPIVCIAATGLADENMLRFAELAGLLGADLTSPELATAKSDYDASVDAFTALATEKADLEILFAYVTAEVEWYAASPQDWADLAFYQTLGLNIIEPPAEKGMYWETLSREQALKYPSDVFFNSTRLGTYDLAQLQSDVTFGQHPAIKAGQVGAWNQDFIMSYQGLKAALDTMTVTLQEATKVL